MNLYADTNFFTRLLVPLSDHEEAEDLADGLRKGGGALPIPWLIRMELTNALQRLVYESKYEPLGYTVTPEFALMAEAQLADELDDGRAWRAVEVRQSDVEQWFTTLVHRHTARHGFRTYDLLHVSAALVLGCDTFWSFDLKAKKLAQLEGLRTN